MNFSAKTFTGTSPCEDKDKIKLSFRSQGDVPVNVLAEKFGGGGHKNAAGGESYTSLENTIVKLKEILQN